MMFDLLWCQGLTTPLLLLLWLLVEGVIPLTQVCLKDSLIFILNDYIFN